MIKVFETFAGYGGASWGLKLARIKHKVVGYSEIDKYACQIYENNFPKTKGLNYGDITKINWKEVPDFDLLTGGFPCQSFSFAGKQLGHNDTRGVLGLELTKALHYKQPKYFLFENVKGLMSKKFDDFRAGLIESWRREGYNVSYKVLNSKEHGVPQNRERVWFVGIRNDIYKPFEFQYPNKIELKLKLKDILEDEVDDKYYLKPEQEENY